MYSVLEVVAPLWSSSEVRGGFPSGGPWLSRVCCPATALQLTALTARGGKNKKNNLPSIGLESQASKTDLQISFSRKRGENPRDQALALPIQLWQRT